MRVTFKPTLAAALLAALAPLAFMSHGSDADGADVLLSEVDPPDAGGKAYGFSVTNYGPKEVDLKGYYFTDNSKSGRVTVTSSVVLAPSDTVTFASEKVEGDPFQTGKVYAFGDRTEVAKGFSLSVSSDYVVMHDPSGNAVDSFAYGSLKASPEGWKGQPAYVKNGDFAVRVGAVDSDTRSDWNFYKEGWSMYSYGMSFEGAEVTSFAFPDSGGVPIFRALEGATESVRISIYLISSPNVIAELIGLAEKGVDVKVMVEGNPLGIKVQSENNELSLLRCLRDAGAEVSVINYPGADAGRYSYVHNKYAVIDGDTVVITSENWTKENLTAGKGNRGWGAVIEHPGYARYMQRVFENDCTGKHGDVLGLAEAEERYAAKSDYSPTKYSGDLTYSSPEDVGGTATFTATVSPVLSPDNSYNTLRQVFYSATGTLYVEEMDIDAVLSAVEDPSSALYWFRDAADRGVDSRFVLAADGKGEHAAIVNDLNGSTKVKAKLIDPRKSVDGFSTMHNKGIIADGSAWVGSVNWTMNSFDRNRETAVYIQSKDAAAFYSAYLLKDFGDVTPTMGNGSPAGSGKDPSVPITTRSNYPDVQGTGPAGPEPDPKPGENDARTSSEESKAPIAIAAAALALLVLAGASAQRKMRRPGSSSGKSKGGKGGRR